MQNIDINQVKQQLPKILEDIEDAIIITKQGLPIAKIVGIPPQKTTTVRLSQRID